MTFVVGDAAHVSSVPSPVFDPLRMEFLGDLSRRLLESPRAREFPDIVTFAFWCRRANLNRMKTQSDLRHCRVGLGLLFHVSPSNVPVNFAFSLVFGLLSGNCNVVRLPSRPSEPATLIPQLVAALLEEPKYSQLRSAIHLVRYDKNEEVTPFWVAVADGRVIWGGDATVRQIRSYPSPARAREVAFPDRYSFGVLGARAVCEADDAVFEKLCANLYNDLYLMDQNACSSPQLIAWLGTDSEVQAAQARLWPAIERVAGARYALEPIQVMDKYVACCSKVLSEANIGSAIRHENWLYRMQLTHAAEGQSDQRGYFGTVHELRVAELAELASLGDARCQTLVYFGVEPDLLREFVLENHLQGVDRIVPVGSALDMDVYWDGYDLVSALSRIIDVR